LLRRRPPLPSVPGFPGVDAPMLERVISGGQTGADQAALRAALAAGIPTGGFAPLGWETEAAPAPWLKDYGLVECSTSGYPARTAANVRTSDATLWFGSAATPGAVMTLTTCVELGKPCMVVRPGGAVKPSHVVAWIVRDRFRVVNVAGNRESKSPGTGDRVERFLAQVFRQLRAFEGEPR
jgi:putative molybdenum carrier protein